jgi:hypothetical protein
MISPPSAGPVGKSQRLRHQHIAGKRGRIYFAHFHGLNDRSWPIVLKKSVLAGAAFPELKKRTTWALLCEKQGNSVSSTVQIST